MQKENNKPIIRFKGYTDAWEQRKVGELLIERNEQAPMNEEYPLMAFIANEGVAPKGERYDRSSLVSDTENKLYKRTEFGDFIYSSNNLETGSIGLNKYGKASISPVYSIFCPTGIADSDFLGRRLVRKDFINAMVKWRQGVIYGQWRIHESDFLKIEIPVPLIKEQRKIGAFFHYIDNLITLHQRKYEKLKNIKKSMLEKMFPKKGSNVPEIRFNGFTDAWEQRKLNDMCDLITKQTGFDYSTTIKPALVTMHEEHTYSFIQNKDFDGEKINMETDFYIPISVAEKFPKITLDCPSLLISISGKIGNVGYYNRIEKAFIGGAVGICKLKNDNGPLLVYALQSDAGQNYFHSLTKASSHANITVEDIRNITLILPTSKAEENKIIDYFHNLDNLITLHQRKLEKLQNIKKACLDKMFV